jgi:hypothetical protein
MEVHHHPKVENPAHGGTGKNSKNIFGVHNDIFKLFWKMGRSVS